MIKRHAGTSVCFTGHRPHKLGGYDEDTEQIHRIKAHLTHFIHLAILSGRFTFISGMAIGVDTWAAEIVLEAKKQYPELQLVCAVPFKGQENKWTQESQDRYQKILDNADEIVVVSEGSYTPAKMQIRNAWMVDNSSIVIAVWDGTSGGTGNCVKYAKRKKAEVWTIDP